MKRTSAFFSILLLAWVTLSTYWYVCKIKNDCYNKEQITISTEENNIKPTKEFKKDSVIKIAETNKEQTFSEELSKGFTVYNFPKNSETTTEINKDFKEFANKLKNYLTKNVNSKVEIIGYTDNSGSKKTNLLFGKKRAIFIKNKLVNEGINENFLIVKSFGEAFPVVTNKTEEGRLKNRRVIIKLIKNK